MNTFGLVPKLAVELCFGRMEDRNEFQQDVIPGLIAVSVDHSLKATVTVWPF